MNFPNWRKDKDVIRLGQKLNEILARVEPINRQIKEAILQVRRLEAIQRDTEDRMLRDAVGPTASPTDVLHARQQVDTANAVVRRLQDENQELLESYAVIESEYRQAEAKARAEAAAKLRDIYVKTAAQAEGAFETAVRANGELEQCWNAISGQDIKGFGSLVWNWPRLNADALHSWRARRASLRLASESELQRHDREKAAQAERDEAGAVRSRRALLRGLPFGIGNH